MQETMYPGPFIRFNASPWLEFLNAGLKRSFPAHATILPPGDHATHLYFVAQGEIITTHFFSADDSFKVNVIGTNAVAGIFEVFSPLSPKASWHTLSASICYLYTKEQVLNELPRTLLLNILEQAALMGTTMAERLTQYAGKRHDVRVARFLLHFVEAAPTSKASKDGHGVTIIPNITQEVSSELLGMHPVTFNKLLAAFRKRGIIGKSKRSSLEILDLAALTRFAQGDLPPVM